MYTDTLFRFMLELVFIFNSYEKIKLMVNVNVTIMTIIAIKTILDKRCFQMPSNIMCSNNNL